MNHQLEKVKGNVSAIPDGKVQIITHSPENIKKNSILENLNTDCKGKGKIETYSIYPGMDLSFLDILSDSISFHHMESPAVMKINYCRYGRIGCNLKDNNAIYLGMGDFSLSTMDMCADSAIILPLGYYEGITICVDLQKLTEEPPEILIGSGVTGKLLYQKFCSDGKSAVITGNDKTEHIFSQFYEQSENLQIPYFKIRVLELLLYLYTIDYSFSKKITRYQSEQIEMIKQIHAQLLQNLDQRFTIETLSKQYLMNATTLKALFKTVYGTSIAAHIKEHRLEKAAILLCETGDSIASIAKRVGYDSQSKFTTAFREMFGMLPTEYRKQHLFIK